jgi:hypothetical protein
MSKRIASLFHGLLLLTITVLTYSCSKSDHLPTARTRLDKIVFDSASIHATELTFQYNTDNKVIGTSLKDIAWSDAPNFSITYPAANQIKYANKKDPQQYDLYELTADQYPLTREKVVMSTVGYQTFRYRYVYNSHKELDSVLVTNQSTHSMTAYYVFDYADGNISEITAFQGSNTYTVKMDYDNNENYFRRTDPLLYIYAYPFIDYEARSFAYFFSKNNPRVFRHTDVRPPSYTFDLTATADKKVGTYYYDGDQAYKITYHYTNY